MTAREQPAAASLIHLGRGDISLPTCQPLMTATPMPTITISITSMSIPLERQRFKTSLGAARPSANPRSAPAFLFDQIERVIIIVIGWAASVQARMAVLHNVRRRIPTETVIVEPISCIRIPRP